MATAEQQTSSDVIHRDLLTRYSQLEERYAHLTRFCVATNRLLDAHSQQELFPAVLEIIANLVGSEQVAIFRLDDGACRLALVSSCGVEENKFHTMPLGASLIGQVAVAGEPWFAGQGSRWMMPQETHLAACLPLRAANRLLGAITVFELLPQKRSLSPEDREILELVAKYTANALQCNCSGWNANTRS